MPEDEFLTGMTAGLVSTGSVLLGTNDLKKAQQAGLSAGGIALLAAAGSDLVGEGDLPSDLPGTHPDTLTGFGMGASMLGAAYQQAAPSEGYEFHDGIDFDQTVNAVDDLGMDPTGSEPVDAEFETGMQSGTLIEFPPGTYLMESGHNKSGLVRWGIRGLGNSRRDVTFTTPTGNGLPFLTYSAEGPILIENVSFDEKGDDPTHIWMDLSVEEGGYFGNIEFLGKTPNDSKSDYNINADVRNQDGVAVYERIVAGKDGAAVPVGYPDGVAFLRGGGAHQGEVVILDCHIEERNSMATRLTAGEGVVTIKGGRFINNQNGCIRVSPGNHPSKVSHVDGAYVKADGSRNTADAVRMDSGNNTYGGTVYENMVVEWSKHSGRGVFAAPDWANHGSATIRNCVVLNDGGATKSVYADDVGSSGTEIVVEDCAFTGEGEGFISIGRPGSVIRDTCIDMPKASISGFDTSNITESGCRTP